MMMRSPNTKFFANLLLAALALVAIPGYAAEATVNINSAGVEELALLPRVGATVAQRIVDFRDANGDFEAAEELMLVKGIGEKTFELIRPYVALEGATTLAETVRAPRPASSTGGAGEER